MNLNICIQITLFPNFHNKIVLFIYFFIHFCQTAVKSGIESWQPLLSQPTYLTYLTYPTYLTYLTYLPYITYLPNLFKTPDTLDCFSCNREARNLTLVRKLDIARTFYRGVVGAVLASGATPTPHTTGRSLLTTGFFKIAISPWTLNYKDTNPTCRLFWCLIEFIDCRYIPSCWYFQPLLWTVAPLPSLWVLTSATPPPFPKKTYITVYTDSVWLWVGGCWVVL
jgi:hypothetical protein